MKYLKAFCQTQNIKAAIMFSGANPLISPYVLKCTINIIPSIRFCSLDALMMGKMFNSPSFDIKVSVSLIKFLNELNNNLKDLCVLSVWVKNA